jgi:DNA-binding MarR family transcriptional regulator
MERPHDQQTGEWRMIKWRVNLAVRQSDMPPPRRLIMFALSDVADPKSGVIPDERTPSLRELAGWTGLDKSTVTRHLDALDDDGWVIRDRPERDTARRDGVRTKYRLDVPRGAESTTGDDEDVVQSATQHGAENTTDVVHCAPTTVVHSASVPYTDEVKDDKNSSSPKAPKAKPKPDRPDVDKICTHLADRIEANGSLRPNITANWRTEARLLLDKDGRAVEQVLKAIDWCQSDPFWHKNILSMPTLRKQYDRLRLAAVEEERRRANGRASPGRQLVEHNGMHLKPETVANLEGRKRWESMGDNGTHAIEGPR